MNDLAAVMKWLEDVPVLDAVPDSKALQAARELVGGVGLQTLLGLMLGARAAVYVQLAALPLGNSADAARLSVLQGKVQGIDLLRQTLLELFHQPAESKEA